MKWIVLLMLCSSVFALEQKETINIERVLGHITKFEDKEAGVVCYLYNRAKWSSQGNSLQCVRVKK